MNTQIDYMYRDASNYKKGNRQVVAGTLTAVQTQEIMNSCEDGEYFIPFQVGLPEERFGRVTEDDHCWFEMCGISTVDEEPTVAITAEELHQNFLGAAGRWDGTCWKVIDEKANTVYILHGYWVAPDTDGVAIVKVSATIVAAQKALDRIANDKARKYIEMRGRLHESRGERTYEVSDGEKYAKFYITEEVVDYERRLD